MELIITRADARSRKLSRFFTNDPCKKGHLSPRFTGSGMCVKCSAEYNTVYRQVNAEKARMRTAKWREENPGKNQLASAQWRKQNVERSVFSSKANSCNQRSKQYGAKGHLTWEQLKEIYHKQEGNCAYCSKALGGSFHTDHRVPLCLGGSNEVENIVLACGACNRRKHTSIW